MHNKFDMKGGRKLRAPGPSTVHKALKNMTSKERVNAYIEMNDVPPTDIDDLKQLNAFNTKMKQNFAEDVAAAEDRMIYLKDSFYNPPYEQIINNDHLKSIDDVLRMGGKTRRNRNRKRRGRGRRSLKHYSKRC
jgi:hypothetical protein